MRMAAGAITLLIAILIVPTYRSVKKHGDIRQPEWELGVYGNTFFQAVIVISFIVMVIGSVLTID